MLSTTRDARLATIAEAAIDDLFRLRPEVATAVGEHKFDGLLPDLSSTGVDDFVRTMKGHRHELAQVEVAALTAQERVDAGMLATGLDSLILQGERTQEHLWDPLAHDAALPLHTLLARDVWPLEERLASLASRLDLLPEFLATARRTITGAPKIHIETALARLVGLRALITVELDRSVRQAPSFERRLQPLQHAALEAVQLHEEWLLELRSKPHVDPRLGPDVFAEKLPLVLATALSTDEILAAAWTNLDVQEESLESSARQLLREANLADAGTRREVIQEALNLLARDAPTSDTLVERCQAALHEATSAARELGRFSVLDDEVVVQVMPEHRRGVSPAYCDSPGALDRGGQTFVAISPAPSGWSQGQVESYYREYNGAALRNLMVHEAMPGHVLQLAHGRRFRGPTAVRDVFASGTFREGWAVHCEQLMAQAGFGGVPVRIAQLKIQLRMTINAILDIGVHAHGMSEAEAMDLMRNRGFQEEGEARGKWQRVLLTSGQLSTYFVGFTELAPYLAARDNLDELLAHGSPAPRHLETLLHVPQLAELREQSGP